MRSFDEYIKKHDVRKTTPDIGLAQSLKKDAEERVLFIIKLPLTDDSVSLVYEQIYEALRQYIDALLILEGFKSYSHRASISFLQRYPEFSLSEINKLDTAREKRNLSKYYAKKITIEETKDIIQLYHQVKPKLEGIFSKLI